MSSSTRPVVVGVDESPASFGALWWAAQEARLRHLPLLIVHSLSAYTVTEADAQAVVDEAARFVRRSCAGTPAFTVVGTEPAGRELCHQSASAALIVVASRGLGGFAGLLLGSVSGYVATHARCPVLVIHNGQNWAGPERYDTSHHPVVVGVGPHAYPSDDPAGTLAVAFAEAALRHVELRAVRSWRPPPVPGRSDVRPLVADVAELETAERHDLAELLAPWRAKYPQVEVRPSVVPGGAAAALVAAATDAQLVVVGGPDGLQLGSVAQQVLHHAACPVLVVPGIAA
ncbi:MAG TPA: universal stress protein [Micromonosporaceae bacterium]